MREQSASEQNRAARYRAETVYDRAACDALAYLMVNRLRRGPRWMLMITGFASIAFAAWRMASSGRVTAPMMLLLLSGNAVSLFGLFARPFAARMLLASMGKDAKNVYLFSDDEMVVRNRDGQERAYRYAFIRRILRMSGYLFFCMRDGQMYLVREDGVDGPGFEAFLNARRAVTDGVRKPDRAEV